MGSIIMNLKVIWEMSVQAKARPSSAPMTKPLWPLWTWSVQLLPAAFFVIFAVWRLNVGDRIQSDALTSILALLTGSAWFAAALGMLVVRGGRQWLVHRRREWFLSVAIILFGLALMDVLMTGGNNFGSNFQPRSLPTGVGFLDGLPAETGSEPDLPWPFRPHRTTPKADSNPQHPSAAL